MMTATSIKPLPLEPGSTVGMIAPASPHPEEERDRAIAAFRALGYKVKLGASMFAKYGYLAGEDQVRVNDIHEMFQDPEVKAVFCIRGGYGTPRLLDRIDYDVIRNNPKVFVGYSDITGLHTAIQTQTGLVTFHGPVIGELVPEPDHLSWETLFRQISDPAPFGRYAECDDMYQFTITPGEAKGKLIGGNLCLIADTIGTQYEIETQGRILFVEEVGEPPYRIDRMLTQLRLAGKLQAAAGIIFTDFTQCEPDSEKDGLSIRQVLEDIVAPLGVPAYCGFNAGHCKPNLTLPIGVEARMNATEGWLETLEGAVQA